MRIEALSNVVASLESGKRPKGGASGESGTVPSLGGEHLNNDGGFRFENLKYIDEKFFVSLKKGVIKTNDILIVKDGATTGKVSYVGSDFQFERAAINEHLFALTVDTKIANPRYVFSFLKSPQGQKEILKDFRGAAIGGISRGFVDLAQIPLPPLDDQIRIAHLLGNVEGLIAQRKYHLQQLDDLLKSAFLQMFGDPVRNERGWTTQPLGNIASIERGRFSPRPRNDPKFFGGDYPFIQTGDITRSKGRLREYSQTLNELGKKVSKEFKVGTIVIAIVGATIGESAILEIPTYAPDSVIGIVPRSRDASEAIFIEYVLRFWKPVLRAKAPAAARANINIETLRPLAIVMPADRAIFAGAVLKVERLRAAYQASLTNLGDLYGALSQQAFKGELDLSHVPHDMQQLGVEQVT